MSITASRFLSRKRVGYSALAIAVAFVAAFAFFSIYHSPSSSSSTVTRTVKVTRGTVQASVSASGNLSTVKTVEENFVSGGTLTTLTASVGEKVKAGQVLASVDATSQSSAVDQATSSLKVAKMNYTDALKSYANDERSLARDKSTLAIAEADDLVRRMAAGLDTVLGERGTLVSGGERQRLCLARAVLRQPWLFVLDEATSAIDVAAERKILERILGLKPRPTVVMIAHRDESLSCCDRILRFQAGRHVADQSTVPI